MPMYEMCIRDREYTKLNESTDGEYLGVGVVLQQDARTGIVTITRCYEGAPGAKAGLLPGDVIYKVNGEAVMDKELTEVVKIIKGSEDKTAHLEIAREGESDYPVSYTHLQCLSGPHSGEAGKRARHRHLKEGQASAAPRKSQPAEEGLCRDRPRGCSHNICQ